MTHVLTLTSRTDTQLVLAIDAWAGSATAGRIQIGTRPDFENCISQIIQGTATTPYTISSLNRAQTYYTRARSIVGGNPTAWGATKGFTTLEGSDPASPTGVLVRPALIMVPIKVAAWTSSNAVAGFPVENLGRAHPFAGWRAGQVSSSYFNFRAETNYEPIDTIALLGSNLPETATVRVIFHDGGAFAFDQTYDFRASAGLPGRPGYHCLVRLPAPQSARYVELNITSGAPGGQIHLTHALFGKGRVIKNYSELTESPFDLGSADRLRDGSPDAVSGFRGKRTDFTISTMNETLYQTLLSDLGWRVGSTDPVFVAPNTLPGRFLHDRLLYGNMTAGRVSVNRNLYERTFSIESIIN